MIHPANPEKSCKSCAKKRARTITSVLEAEKKRVQLAILAATILLASLFTSVELIFLASVELVVFIEIPLASLLLTTGLLAALWISSWCLLALTGVLALTSFTHVAEIVVLHSVICHVNYSSQCSMVNDRSSTTFVSGLLLATGNQFNTRAKCEGVHYWDLWLNVATRRVVKQYGVEMKSYTRVLLFLQ